MSDMEGFEVRPEDARALLEIAETVDDMTEHERNAYDRVRRTLDEHERHIAQQRWGGPSTADGEPYMIGVNVPTQDEIAEAQVVTWDQLLVTETVDLRRDVKAAYDEWQADIDNARLEEAYRDKLTDLDRNLEERGLERGESLDQELPMQSLDQSLDRGHDRGR
jgi:hypothetical protein